MKRSTIYLFAALLLLAAGSCSVQKKCKAPELDMPAQIVAGQSDSLTLSDRKWWEVYTDTTLCTLISRTLDRNRNMLSAEARIPVGGTLPREQSRTAADAQRAGPRRQ